jgi:environmental stress-induced protein Ves
MLRVLDSSAYISMPWKNGGGSTTEIARSPETGDFDWRVSIASVEQDGPFSRFDGCDRVIVTIEGVGMLLDHGAGEIELDVLEPYAFAGELETHCRLRSGPVRDFNLITRRERLTGDVEVVHLSRDRALTIDTDCVIYVFRGMVAAEGREVAEESSVVGTGALTVVGTGNSTLIVCSLRFL